MASSIAHLIDVLQRHAPTDGTFSTAVPGLRLMRCSAPTYSIPTVYTLTLCLVAQWLGLRINPSAVVVRSWAQWPTRAHRRHPARRRCDVLGAAFAPAFWLLLPDRALWRRQLPAHWQYSSQICRQ
ncbi:AraC family transcriptional regulator [Xanthomonas campestris]|uniref:AraC family transcriptional regulator n=1 Tax=Xanthomonas campestris TaxID=339 RepID=UPI0020C76F00|nr:AraC family transcriptional regulator [Xanthomonas campestris]